ncbi:putative sidestep protein, partial [Operophtera brumata]
VDFRNGPPVHWAVAGEFGTRSHFVLNESDTSSAHLAVEKAARQDEGLYRCRIDYIDSPTRNYRVNLTVIVPPESPRIYDYEGREIIGTNAGPFREGQNVLLSCQAAGGKPPPDVSWYRGNELLAITKEGSVSQLHLPSLTREMAGMRLQCRVEPPLLKAMYRDVSVKLYCQDRSFVCTTRGSKPAPNIDWFLNSQIVDSSNTQVEVDGEVTKSVLTWHIRREDSGRQLVCRVSNAWEDENAEILCSADASPPAVNFTFYKGAEVHLIRDDPIAGVSVERNKLMLRGLRRHHAAVYRCRARNTEGSALSEPLTLNIEHIEQIPASNVTVTEASSTVIHGLPSDEEEDLGWLACWASNDVGNQREPCLFRIMPAALPEAPSNCEIDNELLSCEPGHDGGLAQKFLLEALEVRPRESAMDNEISTLNDQGISARGLSETIYRARNDKPQFSLDALSPGKYTLLVYAETPRGSTILRRNVGVSMYGGSVTPGVMPTVVLRGHRGSRVLAASY